MPHLFCFGLGFTAETLARRLIAQGWQVSGTSRSLAHPGTPSADGIARLEYDGKGPDPMVARVLATATHVLVSIPPSDTGDRVVDDYGHAIATLGDRIGWIGYLSTTGVYGDRDGGRVDETSPLEPTTERGARRLAAERAWLDLGRRTGQPVHLFRLAGIYGPGRNAFVSLRTGKARRVIKPGQVFSRIHVEDIASVLEASIARPDPGAAYNVCDDEACPPQDVITHAAGLMGVEPPPEIPFEEADLSPMARSFYSESKVVGNTLIKTGLGVTLAYPTYREGLAALLESDGGGA